MPVTPATLVNSRACCETVLADGGVEHEQHFVRRALGRARARRAGSCPARSSGSRACAGGRPCRRESDPRPRRLARLNRVEDDAPPDRRLPSRESMSTLARLAQISSCSTAAARNVSAAQTSGCWPGRLQQVGQLADGRRLSGAVDADDQRHVGMVAVPAQAARRRRRLPDLFLHQIAQALTVPGP